MHFSQLRRMLTFDADPIKVVMESKFSSLIFYTNLSFISHIKYLQTRCLKALDILRVLSSSEWGADREVLLTVYRTLVRSRLDYGSIIKCGSARNSYIGLARSSRAAFRTSLVQSIYVKVNKSSLNNMRIN